MFKGLLGGLFKATGALVLAVGVIGVLVGVERLLSSMDKEPKNSNPDNPRPSDPQPVPVAPLEAPAVPSPQERYFSIKRTKSEVGYVYWILEGFGKHKCFVLCDTWEEAVAQAKARLAAADADTADTPALALAQGALV
jgi:hypothetical protein